MIFVTSGSMLPFDRLFRVVDDAIERGLIEEEVFGQIGEGKYEPKNFEFVRFVDKADFDKYIKEASLILGHAGIGVIIQALDSGTPLLVLPRRQKFGAHVQEHQVATALKFEELGHLLAFEEGDLAEKLERVKTFTPKPRRPRVDEVGERVAEFLKAL